MAVYCKFTSEKDYYALPIDGPSISVFGLKMRISNLKVHGKGKDYDLILTNAQTNQEYTEDTAMIQTSTSILIRRLAGPPRKPIVTRGPEVAEKYEVVALATNSSTKELLDEPDHDMADDVCFALKNDPDQPTSHALSRLEEDRRIKALVNTPALDWSQTKKKNTYYREGNTPRVSHGRMACSYGHGLVGFWKPPASYICRRCNEPGHYIQHCPTNGDPKYDIKKFKKATGIPKSMLLISSDGSYSLPNGATAVLQPNEAAFEKAIEGIPSAFDARPTSDILPELKCPLCTQLMKDAVLSSKCCCDSYCDKCIRDHIITKKMCVCGSRNVLADDLLPNKTIRELIDSMLMPKSTSSSKKTGTSSSVTDIGSEKYEESRQKLIYDATEYTEMNTKAYANKLEAVSEPASMKKSVPRENAPVSQGIKRKLIEEEKGTKKKKTQNTASTAAESRISQSGLASTSESSTSQSNFASNEENFGNMAFADISASYYGGMPFTLPTYNPYWFSGGMPWGFDGYTASYYPAGTPCMYYSASVDDVAGSPNLQDPSGVQSYPDRYQRH